jgi:hypothetical protein
MSGVQVPLSLYFPKKYYFYFLKLTVKKLEKQRNKFFMPQLDIYVAMSQVFWFTILFVIFYILIVRDILPVLARSIKLRKKKVGGSSGSSLDTETNTIIAQTATTLETSLNDSRTLLSNVSTASSSVKDVNENTLLELNKTYVKTIGELKGRSFLIEETIKQK